jgi:hypothetical protein
MYHENISHLSELWLKRVVRCGLLARIDKEGCLLLHHPSLQGICLNECVTPIINIFPLYLIVDLFTNPIMRCMIGYLDVRGRLLNRAPLDAWFDRGLNEIRFVEDGGLRCVKLHQGSGCLVPSGTSDLTLSLESKCIGPRFKKLLVSIPVAYDARRVHHLAPRPNADRLK